MMTRVRIKSDGKITRITDIDTGRDLTGVTEVKIELVAGQPSLARVTQFFQIVELDVPADLHEVNVVPMEKLLTR